MNGPRDNRPWFEREPERLEWERKQFDEFGIAFESSQDLSGRLVLKVRLPYRGEEVEFTLEFPREYALLGPRVYGPKGLLKRHQQPVSGNVCLVDDEGSWWRPHYPAVWLIERLRALLEADEAGVVGPGEAEMPEPLSGYLPGRASLTVLVDDAALDTDLGATRGGFTLAEASSSLKVLTHLRGGERDHAINEKLARRLGVEEPAREIEGEWFDLEEFEDVTDWPEVINRASRAVNEGARTARRGRGGRRRRRPSRHHWIGITLLEEGGRQGERRRVWFFFELEGDPGKEEKPTMIGGPISTQAASRAVRRQRTHELSGLERTRFVIVGVGSIGGPLTLELVRADAGPITVLDADTYDLNNSVRHVLPTSAAGANKAKAIAEQAALLNPFAEVEALEFNVGELGKSGDVLAAIAAADVVIDATASPSITRLLHRDCVAAETPLITVAMTPGAQGGRVLLLRHSSPCLDCFFAAQEAGEIPSPPSAAPAAFTPYGCSHPAASGAGFDVTELVAVTARRIIQVAGTTEYPDVASDWIVLSFRDYIPGKRFQEGVLDKHGDCPLCA